MLTFLFVVKPITSILLENKLVSGHDISDGGLITTILEMCFGGVIGVNVNITHKRSDAVSTLFAEEVGWLLEVDNENVTYVLSEFKNAGVPCYEIGRTCGFGMTVPVSFQASNLVPNIVIRY